MDVQPISDQSQIQALAFIDEHRAYIDTVVARPVGAETSRLTGIAAYAVQAGGKRLRPAMTLMLADALGVKWTHIEPLLRAIEYVHTASLVFDDLPAQDNAALRRGKPATHIAYEESGAQLAGIALVTAAFGCLSELDREFPAAEVTAVVRYYADVLGPDRVFKGQDIDLRLERGDLTVYEQDIIEMYALKTSVLIEAALVPLMMLTHCPKTQQHALRAFAHHAGIIFQLRDDVLDVTGTQAQLGKAIHADTTKINVVRLQGIQSAQQRILQELRLAHKACAAVPFKTNLLQGTARYFATRTK